MLEPGVPVIGWLIVGALAWCIVLVLFAAVLLQSSRASPPAPAVEVAAPPPADTGPRQQANPESDEGWSVTGASSAHDALVVEVVVRRPQDPGEIARQIVEPVRERYTEVLVYIRPADQSSGPMVRIRWTPGGGFRQTEIRE